MPIPFSGPGTRLGADDIPAVARAWKLEVPIVQAVMTVETGDGCGFLADGTGRLKALLEAKHFGDNTGHRWDATHPLISTRVQNWKLYRGGAAEYDRINEAVALDRSAALESTSWGLFQCMGSNFDMLGFVAVEDMVKAFTMSERAQLDGFVAYCEKRHLIPLLQAKAWDRFAALYNGPDYQLNSYDTRLATAYAMAKGRLQPFMTLGSSGADVAALQRALTAAGFPLVADGAFGPATAFAVRRFQSAHGLVVDGIPGAAVQAALLARG